MALGEIGAIRVPLSSPREQNQAKRKADQKNDRLAEEKSKNRIREAT